MIPARRLSKLEVFLSMTKTREAAWTPPRRAPEKYIKELRSLLILEPRALRRACGQGSKSLYGSAWFGSVWGWIG